ncbi:cysteine desulfurase/selenocysteine lyase [Constrictibacter sp. MBR-5]|jgi:selenocysteine lyase/cysteine desulfurase|uniref:aminotransferase class V-fold PLP-dependent enzyme n=1 Tax=Constrictibacter sp. MBR-5 TaxID=3156467 RepID=UPI003397B04B
MTIDLERARAETPGTAHVTHFNNAGAALPPQAVLDAAIGHLRLEAEIGGYEAAARAADAIDGCYHAVARLLNCAPDEVAVVENATRAWDMAFYSMPFRPGDRILTAQAEYASNYIAFLHAARRMGVTVEPVPDDEHGQLSVEALRGMIDDRVKLIAVTHVPTNGGLVNPAAAIGAVARAAGVPFLLDACQSVGQMPIDVAAIGCDMLSATSRKYLRGPRGMGFLYVRRGLVESLDPPLLDLHAASWTGPDSYEIRADARRFENWECSYAAKIGMGVAVEYALSWGLPAIEARIAHLAALLRDGLSAIPGVTVRDRGTKRCGIVSFDIAGVDPEAVKATLAGQKINVSVSRVGSTRLDMTARGLDAVVRASVHYYNSEDEVERLVGFVRRAGRG